MNQSENLNNNLNGTTNVNPVGMPMTPEQPTVMPVAQPVQAAPAPVPNVVQPVVAAPMAQSVQPAVTEPLPVAPVQPASNELPIEIQTAVPVKSVEAEKPLAGQVQDTNQVVNNTMPAYEQQAITPSPELAAPSTVMDPTPLDKVSGIPESFSMAAYYKPVVDFTRKEETEKQKEQGLQQSNIDQVLNANNQTLQPSNMKKKSGKGIFGILLLLILIGVAVGAYFMFFSEDKKENDKDEDKEPEVTEPIDEPEKRPDWDSSTSKIKISDSATKLVCSRETSDNDVINRITYTHVYDGGIYTQVVIEDELIFNEDTIKYYDYYVGANEEKLGEQEELYDNITIEVREKKESVSLASSFDLTASAENPKNMLENTDFTMNDMKTKMEMENFICE